MAVTEEILKAKVSEVLNKAERRKELTTVNSEGSLVAIPNLIETIREHYTLDKVPRDYQAADILKYSVEPGAGLFYEAGAGKTLPAIYLALAHILAGRATRAVCIMPPILLDQWAEQLAGTPEVSVMIYRGNSRERKVLQKTIGQHTFTLVGATIFKMDYKVFDNAFGSDTLAIRDEAHDVKNMSTANFKKWRDFTADKWFCMLTGTPTSSPEDAYVYIKMLTPSVYRNKTHFMNVHADKRDFFNNVTTWKNLDVLHENLALRTTRVLKKDVLKYLKDPVITPLAYSLAPEHLALYNTLMNEQLILLGDRKIDATSTQKLMHALGQIICNWDHFSDDDSKVANCYALIEQVLDELGPDGKLIVFAVYRMTNASLVRRLAKYGAVVAYGGQTVKQNKAAADKFKKDATCRVLIAQPSSVGVGLDGLQDVCQDAIFLEIPSWREYQQAVARLYRSGQQGLVHVRIALAKGTFQKFKMDNLAERDSVINKVIRNAHDLKTILSGGTIVEA